MEFLRWFQRRTGTSCLSNVANSGFDAYVFIDTNVVLEGLPLAQVPWAELVGPGAVLIVCVPTVLNEIDRKKQDGRLGETARAFGRLVRPVALSGKPVVLDGEGGRVHLGLATVGRLAWQAYSHLEQTDADSRIVLECIQAHEGRIGKRLFVSHDTRALAIARQEGLEAAGLPESWLRPKAPSSDEASVRRLTERVRELENTQPKLEAKVQFPVRSPTVYRVSPMTDAEKHALIWNITERNPKPERDANAMRWGSVRANSNRVSDADYERYVNGAVPTFVNNYTRILEEHHNQFPIRVSIRNIGSIQAEALVVRVTVSTGWLNEKPVLRALDGPAPVSSQPDPFYIAPFIQANTRSPPGRHETFLDVVPVRSRTLVMHCEDFRHGETWTFDGVVFLDPHEGASCRVAVAITAGNLRGTVSVAEEYAFTIIDAEHEALVGEASPQGYVFEKLREAAASRDWGLLDVVRDED
jgi:hypothetical protein